MTNPDKNTEDLWVSATTAYRCGDKGLSLQIFKEIAESGNKYSFVEIANIYEHGGNNLVADIEKAKLWYGKAMYGIGDEEAYLALARISYLGQDGDVNYEKAFNLYSDEVLSENAVAHLRLGVMYNLGENVKKDIEEAGFHYKKSIRGGNLLSLGYLAKLYFDNKKYFKGILLRLVIIMVMLPKIIGLIGDTSFRRF